MKKKFIGNKAFYRKLLWLAIPIMMQNAITNIVGFLDNIMVGQLGTEQMSGVAIMNQLVFIFNLCIFGGLSGASIFGAQYYGNGDHKGVRNTFRFKIMTALLIVIGAVTVFIIFGDSLIGLYLTSGDANSINETFHYAKEYLWIIILDFLPFAIAQVYASTLRETGQTLVPMIAGAVSVVVNLIFNYILIFGKFGSPKLGIAGAAIATVLARFVECFIVVIWTHRNKAKNLFIVGAYKTFRLPLALAKSILIKGSPLLLNEVLWATGIAIINQCLAQRGMEVVAGTNIASTIGNLFNIIFISLGNAVAIMVGQHLGANEFEKAKDTSTKVIAFSVFCTIIMSAIMFILAPLFPLLYNTSTEIRDMAAVMIRITAVVMPIQAFIHAAYFTIRSGGKTAITFLFDSGFSWLFVIPVMYLIIRFSPLAILPLYAIYLSLDVIKAIIGYALLKKGIWLQNIIV